MKKIGIIFVGILLLTACKNDEKNNINTELIKEKGTTEAKKVELTICDCLDSLEENNAWCLENFPNPITIDQQFECTGDSSLLDTIPAEVKDSIRNDYENDLSLEIKEIEEEKEDPISEECKQFLEDYASAIKDFKSLSVQVDKNPQDIGLKISYASQSEDLESWSSRPQMFKCSQSESFKTQLEILNVKKDKLIEN